MNAAAESPRHAPVRVGCVDDHPTICEAIGRVLNPARFALVGAVASITEIEWLLRRIEPELLLLDVDMPDGEQPLHWLHRCAPRFPATRFVIYSALVSPELVERSLDAGAWGYIAKDDDPALLAALLERILGGEIALSPSARLCA